MVTVRGDSRLFPTCPARGHECPRMNTLRQPAVLTRVPPPSRRMMGRGRRHLNEFDSEGR